MPALCTAAVVGCLLILPTLAQDGTATLTGTVQDILGAEIADTLAELESVQAPVTIFQTVADARGVYRFSRLPAGEFNLKLSRIGFYSLTAKSAPISDGEHRTMPTLQLAAGANGACRDHVELDPGTIPFLRSGDNVGSLGGTVRLDEGLGKSKLIPGAEVTLICNAGEACGAGKTDSTGQFLFKALPLGYFAVRVTAEGFYSQGSPAFRVGKGIESAYTSIHIERCPAGNCDPKLRSKKPIVICE